MFSHAVALVILVLRLLALAAAVLGGSGAGVEGVVASGSGGKIVASSACAGAQCGPCPGSWPVPDGEMVERVRASVLGFRSRGLTALDMGNKSFKLSLRAIQALDDCKTQALPAESSKRQ